MVRSLQEIIWHFLKKLNIKLPHSPAIPALLIEMKTHAHTKTRTQMFTAASLIIAER